MSKAQWTLVFVTVNLQVEHVANLAVQATYSISQRGACLMRLGSRSLHHRRGIHA